MSPTTPSAQANLTQAYANLTRLLVLVQQIVAVQGLGQQPNQAQVDAVCAAANAAGAPSPTAVLTPKPDYSLDGESYSWASYQQTILNMLLPLEQAMQRASGPFWVISRGAV